MKPFNTWEKHPHNPKFISCVSYTTDKGKTMIMRGKPTTQKKARAEAGSFRNNGHKAWVEDTRGAKDGGHF